MTAFSWPISVMPLIRFFFKDIIKFLLKSRLYWGRVCGLLSDPACCKNCLLFYSPITARISPMVCIPRIRFFFIVIALPPNQLWWIRKTSVTETYDISACSSVFFLSHILLLHIRLLHCGFYFYLTPAGGPVVFSIRSDQRESECYRTPPSH